MRGLMIAVSFAVFFGSVASAQVEVPRIERFGGKVAETLTRSSTLRGSAGEWGPCAVITQRPGGPGDDTISLTIRCDVEGGVMHLRAPEGGVVRINLHRLIYTEQSYPALGRRTRAYTFSGEMPGMSSNSVTLRLIETRNSTVAVPTWRGVIQMIDANLSHQLQEIVVH